MKKYHVTRRAAIASLALVSGSCGSRSGTSAQPFSDALKELRLRLNLSETEFSMALWEAVVLQERVAKHGLGPLGSSAVAVLDGERNALYLRPGDPMRPPDWTGDAAERPQIVMLVKGEVVATASADDESDVQLVRFSRNSVQFVDFRRRASGLYRRRSAAT